MSSVYMTNELKSTLIALFKVLFAADVDFPYNKDDITRTKLIVSPRYVTPQAESFTPQLIVSTASYGAETEDFIGNNLYENVVVNATSVDKKYILLVRFQINIDAISTVKVEAELLADKVFNMLCFEYPELMHMLGITVRNVSVGEATVKSQYPQNQFVCSITAQGDAFLTYIRGPKEENVHLLEHIQTYLTIETD